MIRKDLLFKGERKAISPIIATLLLILIAIAAGVVVYAYVIGFVGNSTSNSGSTTSVISVDNFCVSATINCNGHAYSITIRNVGTTTIAASTVDLYFNDVTAGTSGADTTNCQITGASGLAPGATLTCSNVLPSGITAASGHQITVKAVASDGGSATSSTHEIA